MKRYYRLPMKKLSDQITWLQNNALRLLQEYWGLLLLAIVAISLLIIWPSDIKPYERFDLTLKILGGLLAAYAISIASRRSKTAERQIESAVKGQYSDRFAKAVEQIASDQLAIRLGGLASIEALSKETEDEFERVWKYLGHFLRYPPELAEWSDKPRVARIEKEQEELLGRRPDIAAIATMLRNRDETHLCWMERKRLPLEYANLQGAHLSEAKLQGAHLSHAKLQGAYLSHAKLQNTNLGHANLQGADLSCAYLQGANLAHANLQGADLFRTNLQRAHLRKVSLHERGLQQLFSEDYGTSIKNAFFSLDVLKEALYIKGLISGKMSDVYYDASDEILPDDWPEDNKPQPTTPIEWWEFLKFPED